MKFIYLTDTHIGANPIGFHQQPAYPNLVKGLFDQIENTIEHEDIDFIIHGGDLVDYCNEELIKSAADEFDLSIPSYLCLGNHDLDHKDALNIWLENASKLFVGSSPVYKIIKNQVVVHIVPNHWEYGYEYYWEEKQEPYFTKDQLTQLENNIKDFPNHIHVLVTHNPVYGVSKSQSGLEQTIHDVPISFRKTITDLIKKYPEIKLVLSGHNHINTLHQTKDTIFVTASAFIETPFEYKIIEITESYIKVSTEFIDINKLNGFIPKYNSKLKYVQGREKDRDLLKYFK